MCKSHTVPVWPHALRPLAHLLLPQLLLKLLLPLLLPLQLLRQPRQLPLQRRHLLPSTSARRRRHLGQLPGVVRTQLRQLLLQVLLRLRTQQAGSARPPLEPTPLPIDLKM